MEDKVIILGRPAEGPDSVDTSAPTERGNDGAGSDEVTGASPGTAQACSDLGFNSLENNLDKFGIKPPGVA